MKRHIAWLLAALLLACLTGGAWAEAAQQDAPELDLAGGDLEDPALVGPWLGEWEGDGYTLYLRLDEDGIAGRLNHADSGYVWDFDHCWYDAAQNLLWCPNYERYRETIDWDTMELVQEDWSLGDMSFTCFAFGDDADTLVGSDIPHVDGAVTLRRVSDDAFSGQ